MRYTQTMKKIKFLFLSAILLTLSSCLKPDHSLRIENQNARALNVTVNSTTYGLVTPGNTTPYQDIQEGPMQFGGDIQGSGEVSGKGKHKWTMTISGSGKIAVAEDK